MHSLLLVSFWLIKYQVNSASNKKGVLKMSLIELEGRPHPSTLFSSQASEQLQLYNIHQKHTTSGISAICYPYPQLTLLLPQVSTLPTTYVSRISVRCHRHTMILLVSYMWIAANAKMIYHMIRGNTMLWETTPFTSLQVRNLESNFKKQKATCSTSAFISHSDVDAVYSHVDFILYVMPMLIIIE